jgi:internalin A
MLYLLLYIGCSNPENTVRENSFLVFCESDGTLRETVNAIVERLDIPCEEIEPTQIRSLNLSNWSVPLVDITPVSVFTELEVLRLSDSRFNDLGILDGLSNLSVLHLDHTEVKDISGLKNHVRLTELWLDYTFVSDISSIQFLTGLEYIGLRETRILDIQPLTALSNLQIVDISNTAVSDLQPLSNSLQLKALSVRNTQVDSIDVLGIHQRLEFLDIRKNRISNIGVLQGLSMLQAVDIGQNRIESIPFFSGSLKEILLDGNPIGHCPDKPSVVVQSCQKITLQGTDSFVKSCLAKDNLPFSKKVTLQSLEKKWQTTDCMELRSKLSGVVDLKNSLILDLSLLGDIDEITDLKVDFSQINPSFCSDLKPTNTVQKTCHERFLEQTRVVPIPNGFLQLCRDSTDVDIQHTFFVLSQEAGTKDCAKMWEVLSTRSQLKITRSGIKTLEPLRYFTKLQGLYADYNEIKDLSPLQGLKDLQLLWFDDNLVSDLRPLAHLKELLWVGAGDNLIRDISALGQLPNLQRVWLGGNQIVDISPLEANIELRKIHLASNKITSVLPLSKLSDLESLYLADNQISDFGPLAQLGNLRFLNPGLDYDESPLEAHRWFISNNPIKHCPLDGPLTLKVACAQAVLR